MNGYKYRANIAVNDKGNLRDIETLIKDELWASSLTDSKRASALSILSI